MSLIDFGGIRMLLARMPRLPRWLAGAAALAIVVAALVVGTARSSVFAIRRIAVSGAPPAQAARVERALRPLLGRSLSSLQPPQVLARIRALPMVSAAAYDRAFPHTLRVYVRTEQPVAVVRRGDRAWLVSAHARVLGTLARRARRDLPRIWLRAGTLVRVGLPLPRTARGPVNAVAPLQGSSFLHQVRSVTVAADGVVVALRSGTELRLGAARAIPLKLAIARRIAPSLADGKAHYLDLTVPNRPVVGVLQPSSRSLR